jgi:uncharacterized protein DUF5648
MEFQMKIPRTLLCVLAASLAFPAAASFHLFRLTQLYSNADGSIQFIQLKEAFGQNNENFLAGHTLTSTQGPTTNTLTFLSNLPSGNTADRSVLIATQGFATLAGITPNYTIPAGFLFPTGGTVSYGEGTDTWFNAVLPTDGVNALNRDGTTGPNQATNFAGVTVSVVAPPPSTVTVVEYHHASFDHYFITPVTAEIALLDAHAPPFQEWSRTGFSFNAYVNATAPTGSVAICRFFNTSFAPKSSHFYGPRGGSCDVTIAMFPDWTLEDDKLFNAMLSDMSGACPTGTIPVYRLYNNGMGGAPNHRFVTSLAERQNMVNQGWIPEGNGIGVETCVPP